MSEPSRPRVRAYAAMVGRRGAEREMGSFPTRRSSDLVVEVGGAEQVVGAQTGLNVHERHIVDRLAARERVAEIGEHAAGCGGGGQLPGGDAQRLGPERRTAVGSPLRWRRL